MALRSSGDQDAAKNPAAPLKSLRNPADMGTMIHPDESTQSLRDFLDHGTARDTQTTYPDGSRREPRYAADDGEESRRPLRPSPFIPKGDTNA